MDAERIMYMIGQLPYVAKGHPGFALEWGPHLATSEWWYATGYLNDETGALYSFQYTLAKRRAKDTDFFVLMLALTDIDGKTHHYGEETSIDGAPVLLTSTTAQWGDKAGAIKGPHSMKVFGYHAEWSFDLELDYGKGAYWHCDDGVLQMGLPGEDQTSTYYSYTNMPTTGTISLGGRTFRVTGKTWFDKQGGPYDAIDRRTHWEWFSLRFDDDEEMMLFSFPQSSYQDGTFIPRSGPARRLNAYTITPTSFVTVNGKRFSSSWTLHVPGIKAEHYTITPLIEGMLNIGYFEQLCSIVDASGKMVGKCFVELLPGVLNEKY